MLSIGLVISQHNMFQLCSCFIGLCLFKKGGVSIFSVKYVFRGYMVVGIFRT